MMRHAAVLVFALTALTSGAAARGGDYVDIPIYTPSGPGTKLICYDVAVTKEYASTPWQMQGCQGERIVLLVAAQDNPLYPYFFMVRPDVIGWDVYGSPMDGPPSAAPRDDTTIRAVRTELKKLRGKEVDALIAESAAAQPATPPAAPSGQ